VDDEHDDRTNFGCGEVDTDYDSDPTFQIGMMNVPKTLQRSWQANVAVEQ
jgi:hypothetical protein